MAGRPPFIFAPERFQYNLACFVTVIELPFFHKRNQGLESLQAVAFGLLSDSFDRIGAAYRAVLDARWGFFLGTWCSPFKPLLKRLNPRLRGAALIDD